MLLISFLISSIYTVPGRKELQMKKESEDIRSKEWTGPGNKRGKKKEKNAQFAEFKYFTLTPIAYFILLYHNSKSICNIFFRLFKKYFLGAPPDQISGKDVWF